MLKNILGKCSLIAVACSLNLSVFAATNPLGNLDVPAGELVDALKTLASQAEVDLVYQPEQLKDLRTDGVKGNYSPQEAVKILLKGTRLRVYTTEKGAMVIASAATANAVGVKLARVVDGVGSEPVDSSESSGGNGESTKLEEIVVTAQKRKESLQDVPISISVLSGKNLERASVDSVLDALSTVPGVSFTEGTQSAGGTVTIRGVAPNGALFFGAPTVGYYLDSVPFGLISQGFSPDSNAYDLERVEVLRGPQGTLYGASALNGVVRVLTANPDLDSFELKARTTASTTEGGDPSYRGDAAVNLPIVAGKLAVRFVAGYEDRGGWIDAPFLNKSNTNDVSVENYRLKLRAQPTDNLTVDLAAWFSRDDRTIGSAADKEMTNLAFVEQPVFVNYDLYGLTVGYDFHAFSLTSATGFMTLENESTSDISSFLTPPAIGYISTRIEDEVFSQELTLNSNQEGPWRWTLGAIYRDGEEKLTQPPYPWNAPLRRRVTNGHRNLSPYSAK